MHYKNNTKVLIAVTAAQKIKIMRPKESIKKSLQELARENFNSFRENYLNSLPAAIEQVKCIAKGYFEERSEEEIKADEKHSINVDDYKRWISWELCSWLNEQDEMKFTNIQELIEWTNEDIKDKFSFNELITGNLFSIDFALIDENDRINFVFNLIQKNDFNSELELSEITSI